MRWFLVLFTLLLLGCPAKTAKTAKTDKTGVAKTAPAKTAAKTVTTAAAATVKEVSCGCVLPDVGKCSEWVKVDGKFVQFAADLGMGKMPFCGKQDLKAKVAGEVKDNKFHHASFELVK